MHFSLRCSYHWEGTTIQVPFRPSKLTPFVSFAFVPRDEANTFPGAMLINNMIESDHVIRLFCVQRGKLRMCCLNDLLTTHPC